MATAIRLFENKTYYHVYNRGNRKQQIFLTDKDYKRFVEKAVFYKEKYQIKIIAYCLMPNHFHFLMQQMMDNSISKFFSNLCNSQSKYFNIKYDTVGSLFQGRFKAKIVEKDEYLVHLSRYIHLNPITLLNTHDKNIFSQLRGYKWSSLACYILGTKNKIVDPWPVLQLFSSKNPSEDYKEFVSSNIRLEADPIIGNLTFDD